MGVLDPVTRRRIAALLLILGTLVVVAATTDVGPFSDPATPEEEVESAVIDFFGAASDGDFKKFCGQLTKQAQATIEARAAAIASQEGLKGWTDQSGAIFLADVGATGLPVPRWSGSTTNPSWNTDKEAHA